MSDLSPSVRLGAFGAALLVVLAASFGLGRLTGDVAPAPEPAPAHSGQEVHE